MISRSMRFSPKQSLSVTTSAQRRGSPRLPQPANGWHIVQACSDGRSAHGTCVRTSAMPYFLGIDGGGTKTRCVLGDATVVLATAMSGGSNIIRQDEQQAREALHSAIEQVCAAARISSGQVSAICVGAAGAARQETAEAMRGIVAKIIPELPPTRIDIVGDTEIALESAFGKGPGVIAIAGTGSIVYGRAADGRTA